MIFATKQDIRIKCLVQIGFAVFGKGVQLLISGSPYAETEQRSRIIPTLVTYLSQTDKIKFHTAIEAFLKTC